MPRPAWRFLDPGDVEQWLSEQYSPDQFRYQYRFANAGQYATRIRRPGDVQRRYYLRFTVVDQPGVLAQITDIFWKYNINIAAVIQKEESQEEFVPIVMTTYLAREGDIQAALEKVNKLEPVKDETKVLRILNTRT